MKKLLAILLTLAMLVPMGGVAEETAPGATRTVIFLKDFNAKVLGADIDEAEEKAVNDFLDALRVIVYQQGTTSAAYEVTLNDQPIVDYAVQFSGADVYVSSDLLGETLYLNLDEDMQHFGELVYRQQLCQRGLTAEVINETVSSGYYAEQIAQLGQMGALTAKLLKNPLFTENVQAEEVLNSLAAIDFTEMQRRLAEYQPSMTIDPVTEQLEGCDPAIQVCTFTLTNEQLVNRLAILLETAMQVPVVQNFADLAADYDNLMQFMSQTTTEEYVPQEIDWAAQVRQQTILYSDAQVTLYTDAQGQLVKLIVNYSALPDWAERMSEVEPTEGILKPVTFTLNRNTLADGLQYDWKLEKEENSTTGRLTIGEKNAELVLMPDDQTQTTISLTVEPNRRGGKVDVEVRTTSEANGTDSGIQFGVFTSGSSRSVYRESRIRLLSGGEVGLTIYTTTFSCEPRPLLSDGDVLDLGEISSARFNAYMLTLATSISQILPRILMNLPNSVRQLMDGTTTLPSSTIILDNAD